jgi:hemolysin activation/secretion protein
VYDDINNFLRFHLDLGRELSPGEEFFLGGESGIRGYPTKLQSGDKRILLNLEQRYYTNWHVFQLYYLAALIFTDVGRAWTTGDPSSGTQGVLKDIGFGLRAGSSRSSTDNVIQLDVAFPLDRNDQMDSYQVVVKASGNF